MRSWRGPSRLSLELQRPPPTSSVCSWIVILYHWGSGRGRERQMKKKERGFSSVCISSHNLAPPPLLFFFPLVLSLPPSLAADPSAALCPSVASGCGRNWGVISIRGTCLLICPLACLPAWLTVCLPVSPLPTAIPCSSPVHLLVNKRLCFSQDIHPSARQYFL